MKQFLTLLLAVSIFNFAFGQCETWESQPNKDDIEANHVIYKQALKTQNWDVAYEYWEKVYSVAPAADGKRHSHFLDGAEILLKQLESVADPGERQALSDRIVGLYEQAAECYKNGAIKPSCEGEACLNKTIAFVYGRLAYTMFYYLNSPYSENIEAIQKAIDAGGVNNEYVIFDPAARITVYQFKNELMEKEEAVNLFTSLNEIADFNILNDEQLSGYFLQAKENMNATFAEIEDDLFDYHYFKEKFQTEYEKDPENPEVLRNIIAVLKQKNCPPEDEFLSLLEDRYKKYAEEENQRLRQEFEANNPAVAAKRLYDEGKFNEAIQKYYEAIEEETENARKANHLFAIASIQFRKLSRFSEARGTALEAVRLRPGWGRPYMLIGDMYGSTARNCGDDWNQRLAIVAAIEKYYKAKAVDPDLAQEAGQRIGIYTKSLPEKGDGFMRGINEGDQVNVGCWISETVSVKFRP
jgi:tetratricopeptide (TPR) repeat protein